MTEFGVASDCAETVTALNAGWPADIRCARAVRSESEMDILGNAKPRL